MNRGQAKKLDVAKIKKANKNVLTCEQDQMLTLNAASTPLLASSMSMAAAQTTDWGVSRVRGPASPVSGRLAYVIDSGVDLDHPDLNVDVGRSRTAIGTTADDSNGHGTHVAGVIGARNNSIGTVGVAPGATIVAIRVLDGNGSGSNSGVIAGVDYVASVGRPYDVANMSLGGGISTALDQAVENAASRGIRFILAAGNESANAAYSSPARVNASNVITVSAMDRYDRFASFSNYGSPVDVAEPGVGILSTYRYGGYATLSGTSMAAPHFAGILMTQNTVRIDGYVRNDPDGRADPIGVRWANSQMRDDLRATL